MALDENLQLPDGPDGVVAARSDQAIGVLLARSQTRAQGRAELAQRAAADSGELDKAARQIIADQVNDRCDDGMTGGGMH